MQIRELYKFSVVFCVTFVVIKVCALPLENTEEITENEEAIREKRSIFPFVIGETILDIQCKRGYPTVCAPDGPNGCPVGYLAQTNVGQCGFATLNHFLNTSNVAGTCCYKMPGSLTTTSTTIRSVLLPQIVAYPVYAQYPFALNGKK